MSEIIIMPKLGLTMSEGMVTNWLKSVGDEVHQGEAIVEIETDKISTTVEASRNGYMIAILVGDSETVPILTPLCVIGDKGEPYNPAPVPPAVVWPSVPEQVAKAEAAQVPWSAAKADSAPSSGKSDFEPKASPLARKIAEENGIDLSLVLPFAAGERISREDVEAYLENRRLAAEHAVEAGVPLTGRRKTIADRLSQSKREIPHAYFRIEVDADAFVARHRRLLPELEKIGIKPTLNDYIVRATALALARHPEINATLEDGKVITHRTVNVCIAVNAPAGLIVPVLKDVLSMSFEKMAAKCSELVRKAKTDSLTLDEVTGGTFTTSNLGALGITEFTAIVNPPQTAILAIGAVFDAPLVRLGKVECGKKLNLTLSVDHRVIDGAKAAEFLRDLKSILENPDTMQ